MLGARGAMCDVTEAGALLLRSLGCPAFVCGLELHYTLLICHFFNLRKCPFGGSSGGKCKEGETGYYEITCKSVSLVWVRYDEDLN